MEIVHTTCEFFEDGMLCLAEALPNQLVFFMKRMFFVPDVAIQVVIVFLG